MPTIPIGDPRPTSTDGPAGDQRKAGEDGPAGDPRPSGATTATTDEDDQPPPTSAPKQSWIDYANSRGYHIDEQATKTQLVDRFGNRPNNSR